MVWKFVKRLYGFRDSSRGWFMGFDSAMKKLGCVPVNTDDAIYVYKNAKGKIVGPAGVHVDDVLYTGEPEFHEKVIKVLSDKYVVRSVESESESELFTFIRWTLSQDKDGISLSHEHYLQQVDMSKFSKSLGQVVRTTTSLKDKRAMVTISILRRIPEAENISVIW